MIEVNVPKYIFEKPQAFNSFSLILWLIAFRIFLDITFLCCNLTSKVRLLQLNSS